MTFPTSEVRVDRTLRVPVVISPTVFSGFDLVFEEHTMFTASCVGKGLWISHWGKDASSVGELEGLSIGVKMEKVQTKS